MEDNVSNNPTSSYTRILKSTFILGGSSVITTVLGIVRTKVIALMLGPSGVGLTGIYMTITSLVSTMTGMGIRESGVRQIAGAFASGNEKIIFVTVASIRRAALISGVAGLCLLFFLSDSISRLTFGSSSRGYDLALLSVTILFGAASGGQIALIQGMRRIGDLAKLSIIGAFLGTILSIPIIYFCGETGIVYILLVVSATAIVSSWWYSGKIEIPAVTVSWRDSLSEAKPLLKLGIALMLGALMTPCTQYFLRVFVVRHDGLSAAGVYQASTTLSVVYVHVILNAMLTDFYPRLSAAAHDNFKCKSLINDQVEVGLLLAVPGILAIMTFAPFVITIFYSSKFMLAVDILRWQILGVVLQVITWPLGFMLRAKGNGKLFIWTELFANSLYLGLAWLGITYFGLIGIGMAYFGMNLSYGVLIYWIVRIHYEFKFSTMNIQLLAIFSLATAIVFLSTHLLTSNISLVINTGITAGVGLLSFKSIIGKTDSKMIPDVLLKIRSCLGLV